jgi:hypothetical protein
MRDVRQTIRSVGKTGVLVGGAALAIASGALPAAATLSLSVTDDGVPVTMDITNNSGGNLAANGSDANFSVGVVATGDPAVPAPALGTVTLSVHAVADITNVLDIIVTQTGLNVPAGFQSETDNTFNGLIGAPGPITQTMFVNGAVLNTVTFPASSGTATQNFSDLIGVPITDNAEEFVMTFAAPAAALETMSFVAAPVATNEPQALASLATALLLLTSVWRWRRGRQ